MPEPATPYLLILFGYAGVLYELMRPGLVAPGVCGAGALLAGVYLLSQSGRAEMVAHPAWILLAAAVVGIPLLFIGHIARRARNNKRADL